ncbi:hypothetical protein SAY87_001180 [Trapa incisa]|uniref:Uncharacterized protein n=1 Tax=Trapa incisa TaxID=236973 RepID=A0AAN7GK28_9MYRT|nr:hypothetical protein SAY87_001180 [Trapa incisa]
MESKSRHRSRSPLGSMSDGQSRRSGGRRRTLTDCTNTVASSSPSSIFTPKAKRRPPPKTDPSSAPEITRISVHGAAENGNSDEVRFTSTLCTSSSKSHDETDLWEVEPMTGYARQRAVEKRESKGKAVAVSFSCSPVKVLRSTGLNGESIHDESKSCPLHLKGQKNHLPRSNNESKELEDIKQQKLYFAEVDAFELLEEDAASGGESD